MSDDTSRPDREDETAAEKHTRETTEGHVKGAEDAADRGLLSRRQADRLIQSGTKAHRGHDMARGLGKVDG